MKVGQKVKVHVTAFPNHEFETKLTSFSPATGAKFAPLPITGLTLLAVFGLFFFIWRELDFRNPVVDLFRNPVVT
jgi:hypothetical protein